jgi:transposase
LEAHDAQHHHPTLNKAKIQGAVEFCEKMNISYYKEDVFRTFNVPRETGYRILRSGSARRTHNQPDHVETRGRKSVISPAQIREMEKILEEDGMEARGLT